MRKHVLTLQGETRKQAASLFTTKENSGAGILMMHGYTGSRLDYADYAPELTNYLGATCLSIDLAGHGKSGGDFQTLTPQQYFYDTLEAYDFLSDLPDVDSARIGVVGASFGGYFAALIAGARSPKSVLLRAPAIYEDHQYDQARESLDYQDMQDFRHSLVHSLPECNLALDAIAEYEGSVTIVESEHDDLIPPAVIQAYLSVAQNGLHRFIAGAQHGLEGVHRQTFREMLVDWAREL